MPHSPSGPLDRGVWVEPETMIMGLGSVQTDATTQKFKFDNDSGSSKLPPKWTTHVELEL